MKKVEVAAIIFRKCMLYCQRYERVVYCMAYIVLDLEWNQAMSAQASVFNKLPIRLRGEIIQIGAVKLNADMTPGEEFQMDVRPVYFRRMHYKVKKLTGFDKERLKNGVSFPEAMAQFRQWCGDGATFLTWGYDDKGIMEQNIIIHDLDWDWIEKWVNLQLIYNRQTGGDRNQKALSTAMEHFGIVQTRVAHDALGDAYNTALVCSRLDMAEGLADYEKNEELLSRRLPSKNGGSEDAPEALEHTAFRDYPSRTAAFAAEEITQVPCPICGAAMENARWVDQGDRRYMTISTCQEHGKHLVRLKFRKVEEGNWSVNRIVYAADQGLTQLYEDKLHAPRKRSRSRRRGRRSKAKKAKTAQPES